MPFWAAELSAAGRASFAEEADFMGPKNERVYRRLTLYIARVGSAPNDDRTLGEITGVTGRYFRQRAWPILQDIFKVRDNRLYHPAIDRGAVLVAKQTDPARSEHARKAANAGWEQRRNLRLVPNEHDGNDVESRIEHDGNDRESGMPIDAHEHAQNMLVDAQLHGISMPGASIAGAPARALSLSKEDSLPSESLPNDRESFAERERAHAIGHNGNDMPTDAREHLNGHAPAAQRARSRRSQPSDALMAMTFDWEPSPASEHEARKRGIDPAELTAKFRNHYIGTGELKANWDGPYRNWCRTECQTDGQRRQGHMTMALPVAKAAEPATLSEAEQAAAKAMDKLTSRMAPVLGWCARHQTGPRPPLPSRFKFHCDEGRSVPAYRWLAVMEAARASDEPCLDLPDFEAFVADPAALEAAMQACEESLTAPDEKARSNG